MNQPKFKEIWFDKFWDEFKYLRNNKSQKNKIKSRLYYRTRSVIRIIFYALIIYLVLGWLPK